MSGAGVVVKPPGAAATDVGGGDAKPSRAAVWAERLGWSALAVFLLLFFTLLKFPEDRLDNLVNRAITDAIRPHGLAFTARESNLTLLPRPRYTLRDVTVMMRGMSQSTHVGEISMRPRLLSLLMGRVGAVLALHQGESELEVAADASSGFVSVDAETPKLDLNQTGLLKILTGLQGSGVLEGDFSLRGAPSEPKSFQGAVDLVLSRFVLGEQLVYGFAIPQILVSKSWIEAGIQDGKVEIRRFELGNLANEHDDFSAKVTGSIELASPTGSSKLDLRVRFRVSEKIKRSLVLIDALLAQGKQADGTYAYRFGGTLDFPMPAPDKP